MCRKHFLAKGDINNIRVKVKDTVVKRHENDAVSVTMLVSELREEPFDPVLIFKPQGIHCPEYPTVPTESFMLALQTELQLELYREYVCSNNSLYRLDTWYQPVQIQVDHLHCPR